MNGIGYGSGSGIGYGSGSGIGYGSGRGNGSGYGRGSGYGGGLICCYGSYGGCGQSEVYTSDIKEDNFKVLDKSNIKNDIIRLR